MQIFLSLVGAAVIAYLLLLGIKSYAKKNSIPDTDPNPTTPSTSETPTQSNKDSK